MWKYSLNPLNLWLFFLAFHSRLSHSQHATYCYSLNKLGYSIMASFSTVVLSMFWDSFFCFSFFFFFIKKHFKHFCLRFHRFSENSKYLFLNDREESAFHCLSNYHLLVLAFLSIFLFPISLCRQESAPWNVCIYWNLWCKLCQLGSGG